MAKGLFGNDMSGNFALYCIFSKPLLCFVFGSSYWLLTPLAQGKFCWCYWLFCNVLGRNSLSTSGVGMRWLVLLLSRNWQISSSDLSSVCFSTTYFLMEQNSDWNETFWRFLWLLVEESLHLCSKNNLSKFLAFWYPEARPQWVGTSETPWPQPSPFRFEILPAFPAWVHVKTSEHRRSCPVWLPGLGLPLLIRRAWLWSSVHDCCMHPCR